MTGLEARWRDICGWTLSIVIHAISLGAAIVIAAEFSTLPRPQPFQWDVSIVTATPPNPMISDLPSISPLESTLAAHEPESESAQVADSPERGRSVNETDRSTPSQEAKPVPSYSRPDESVMADLRQSESQLTETSQHSGAAAPSHHDLSRMNVAQANLPTANSASAEFPPPDVEAVDSAFMASQPAFKQREQLVYRHPVRFREPVVSKVLHADYGWLAQVLFAKVQQFKRYPQVAKNNRWQGDVILQAVISDHGDVGSITVARSSGYAMLDQDAVSLLERASPVALQHPLGQRQVVVQIPIGYRLE